MVVHVRRHLLGGVICKDSSKQHDGSSLSKFVVSLAYLGSCVASNGATTVPLRCRGGHDRRFVFVCGCTECVYKLIHVSACGTTCVLFYFVRWVWGGGISFSVGRLISLSFWITVQMVPIPPPYFQSSTVLCVRFAFRSVVRWNMSRVDGWWRIFNHERAHPGRTSLHSKISRAWVSFYHVHISLGR